MDKKDDGVPSPCLGGGMEIKGLGRLSGSLVFDENGKEIPNIRDIEYVHRVGDVPLIRVTCYPSKVNAMGKIEMVYVCPSCGSKRDGEARDTTVLGDEYTTAVVSRAPGHSNG